MFNKVVLKKNKKESLRIMETGLNNTVNTVNKTQFNDFIHSCFDTVSLRMVKSEERRLYSLAKIQ